MVSQITQLQPVPSAVVGSLPQPLTHAPPKQAILKPAAPSIDQPDELMLTVEKHRQKLFDSGLFKDQNLVGGIAGGTALGGYFAKPGVSGGGVFLGTAAALTAAGVADLGTRAIYPGEADKRKHALVGGAIAGVSGGITKALTGNRILGAAVGVALGTVAGAVKEVYDKVTGTGTPDMHDFYATALGAAAVGSTLAIPFR